MKIFEKIELVDGGPNDRGKVIGYIKAPTLEKAKIILNVDHGFIVLNEITLTEFLERKEEAEKNLEMYNL